MELNEIAKKLKLSKNVNFVHENMNELKNYVACIIMRYDFGEL